MAVAAEQPSAPPFLPLAGALVANYPFAIPVDFRDIATGIDARNVQRLITAISHVAGQHPDDAEIS